MQAHDIKTNRKNKIKKRVGRGGKRGTYSGRGIKGQKARSGRRIRPQYRDILKKIPKKKGYAVRKIGVKSAVVNIREIERVFENNAEISPKTLVARGLIGRISGRAPRVKVLATGEAKKSYIFSGCTFSQKAREMLEKSGSRIISGK